MVNDLFKDEMTKIHAFTQKTYTPAEWDKKQEKEAANPQCAVKSMGACTGNCGNCQK